MIYTDRNDDVLENGDVITIFGDETYDHVFSIGFWHEKSYHTREDKSLILKGVYNNTLTAKIVNKYDCDYWIIIRKAKDKYYAHVMLSNGFVHFDLPFLNKHTSVFADQSLLFDTPEEALGYAKLYLSDKNTKNIVKREPENGLEIYVEHMQDTYKGFRLLEPSCSYDVQLYSTKNEYWFYANSSDWRRVYIDDVYLNLPVVLEEK